MSNVIYLKALFLLATLVLAGAFTHVTAQDMNPQNRRLTEAEQAAIKLEREWLDAYERRDDVAMERIIADNFIITYPNGKVQRKAEILAFLRGQRSPTNPAPKYSTKDVESYVYGDTVILVGLLITERNRNGRIVREWSRYTDVYRKQKTGWQVISSHLSSAAEPPDMK